MKLWGLDLWILCINYEENSGFDCNAEIKNSSFDVKQSNWAGLKAKMKRLVLLKQERKNGHVLYKLSIFPDIAVTDKVKKMDKTHQRGTKMQTIST